MAYGVTVYFENEYDALQFAHSDDWPIDIPGVEYIGEVVEED